MRSAADEASGFGVTDLATVDVVDTYLDTSDWRVFRSHNALRIRRSGGALEATLKALERNKGALSRRREITQPLGAESADALLAGSGVVGDRVQALAGTRPLRRLFDVQTRRRRIELRLLSGETAEVALDDARFIDDADVEIARVRRAELEATDADHAAPFRALADELRAACALTPADRSKFEVGLAAASLHPAGVPDLGPTAVDASMDAGACAQAVLRRQLAIFLEHEPGARLGDDPEALHEMRVATRRLRAALAFFADALPARARQLRGTLQWIGRALGEVRDLDVQIEQVEAWMPAKESPETAASCALLEALAARRRTARMRMLRVLDSSRAERAVAALSEILRRHPVLRSATSRLPIREFATPRVVRLWRRIRKMGDRLDRRSSADDFHEMRIRCKRLRYALEFLTVPIGDVARPLVRGLVEVQDLLGTMQDSRVAIAQVLEVAASRRPRLRRDAARQLGLLVERYARRGARAPLQFGKVYRRLRGDPWKELQRALGSKSEDVE